MSTHIPTNGVHLGMTKADRLWTYAIFGGGGLVLLLLAPLLSNWLASVPIVPFKGALEWVGSFDQTWAWFARPAIGLAAGLVLAVMVIADERHLVVGSDSVVVIHDEDRRVLRRDQIVGVHLEGKKIIIDGDHGRVLFHHHVEARRDEIRAAFVDQSYPWEST